MECGERGEWGECYIPGNVAKHSGECPQTFRGMSSNIPGMSSNILGNVAKYSGECPQTFRGMSQNIPGNVFKHSGECPQTFQECPQTFWGMSPNIPGNVVKHCGECHQTFRGMSPNIPGNVLKYSKECPSAALLLYASSVATRKIHLAPRGIEPQDLCGETSPPQHYAIVNWWVDLTY